MCCVALRDFIDDRRSRILGYRFYEQCGMIPEWGIDIESEMHNTKVFSLKNPGEPDMLRLTLRDCEMISLKEDDICQIYSEGLYDNDCSCIANGSGGLGVPGGMYIQMSHVQNQSGRSYVQTSLRNRDPNILWDCGQTRYL